MGLLSSTQNRVLRLLGSIPHPREGVWSSGLSRELGLRKLGFCSWLEEEMVLHG